ncbi:MAG: DNA polymerase V [Proteobacteria bacterium]|nr:DNA polymerase V [Pseudomonadota bacterium]
MPRGGARQGAGRPVGQGLYGEPTKAVRIPISIVDEVKAFAKSITSSIPLYNFPVEAGVPFLSGDDSCEMYQLKDLNISNPKDCFMAKVSGYSMKDAGILPDDLLLVDRNKEAADGDIIVTSVEGGIVVKRLDKKNGQLVSENKDFTPIKITDHSNLHVWGVVIKVVREL